MKIDYNQGNYTLIIVEIEYKATSMQIPTHI